MPQIFGADVSGYQPGKLPIQGLSFIISKATEGTRITNPNHAGQVAQARAAGLGIGHYHFADGLDPVAEATWFLAVAGWRAGEHLALDVEAPFVNSCPDPVGWAVAFATEVHRRTGIWPDTYMNYSDLSAPVHNWAPLARLGGALWEAAYNNTGPAYSGAWPFVAIWQNADTNQTGGDSDVFYGDLAAWRKYGTPAGSTAPAAPIAPRPAPAPPAPPKPAPAPQAAGTTVVRAGDSLTVIAARLGVALAALQAVNPGVGNLIYPGQVLHVPGGAAPAPHPAGPAACTVDPGDTLSSIGAQFGVPWTTIATLNHLSSPYTIYPGQPLRLH